MRKFLAGVCLAVALCSTAAFADQVRLTNGDRLTGTILKSDGKHLVMNTDFAGEVSIKWSAVQDISSSQPLHLKLKSGETLVGPVSTTDGNLVVTTESGRQVEAPKQAVVNIRNPGEQLAYAKSVNPGLLEAWTGGANFGLALTRGNSQTKNLSLAFNATRKTLHDKLGLYANTVYATNDAPGAIPSTTANAMQGGIRYDHDLNPRLFASAGADFQKDSLQTLNLRSIWGGSLGLHAIKSDRATLDLLGGLNYTRESYEAFTRNSAAGTIGEELLYKLRAATSLTQSAYFYPTLSSARDYRATFNIGTVTKLNKWLGWQNALGDIYASNPPAGKKKNDILFTTGLNLSFTH